MLKTFRPLNADALLVTAVTGLSSEQVAAISAPLNSVEKPKAVATLTSFTVTCDLTLVKLPARYRLYVYVYVLGKKTLAPTSYDPLPQPLKSGLWRLAPDVTGGSADDTNAVSVTLPQSYPVARLHAFIRGLFNPNP